MEKTRNSGNTAVKPLLVNELDDPKSVPNGWYSVPIRLFACFETCKLLPYIHESTQFNIEANNSISIWELVCIEWLTKIKQILEKSVDNPKSPAKFAKVLDLWRRATSGYLEIRSEFESQGIKSEWCGGLPDWLDERSANQIRLTERKVAESRQNENSGPLALFWFCDVAWSVESDLFTAGKSGAGKSAAGKSDKKVIRQIEIRN